MPRTTDINDDSRISHGRNRLSLISSRRGIVDVQFNWIFVLVAGFVIFLFIISIVFSQKHAAETQTSMSAMNQITTILQSKQQTGDVYSETDIPLTTMKFTCDPDYGLFSYIISDGKRADLPTTIMFAPPEVTTNKILIWSQSWSAGFPIGVFTYLTTKDYMILIYSTPPQDGAQESSSDPRGYASQIYNDIQGNITRKLVSPSELQKYSKYEHKRIICIKGDCPDASEAMNMDYLMINPGTKGLYAYGNVTFFNKGVADGEELPYITKAGLYGAVFSYSPEFYSCQMSRALGQFEFKRLLVEKRLELMQQDIDDTDCKNTMSVALDRAILPMKDPALNTENFTSMYEKSENLDSWNTDLMLGSCPKMY